MAARAGVSKGAVSFALNGRPGVGEDTRHRIERAAKELGWHPSARGRALRESRARALGLVMSRPAELLSADPFFGRFLAGVEAVLGERGFALLLVVGDEADEADRYRRLAREGRVDGVFLTDVRIEDPRPGLLRELGLHALAVQPPSDRRTPWVGIDDRPGVAAAVAHLAQLGHRQIGHVAGPARYVHSASRRDAFERACTTAGLEPGPVSTADFTGAGGAAATRALLSLPHPPSALVYANDLMAIAGIQAAASLGLAVPKDLSVVGHDDIPLAGHITPSLTTVAGDVPLLGRAAAEGLLDLVQGRPVASGWLAPPGLVLRASTAPPPPDLPLSVPLHERG